ncbi:MAG TPA: DUF2520 domain-containing protein [Chitinophagales bacterium]|nr:DUF2520 domain-containing protein [Chitinophagales bacterium]HMW11908.1 DUF2520 domain-containing protein [Chitinophagales bacterium]HMX59534.1 DUF2520 domain-containing protein [Chitinophagales bacterium]HMY23122.1 DUF2520 domain-containing protein [Chitinophagales bacterium]HMZ32995.1 DUF2520 domain-containing protein [Chitinophagales bacterium]
MQDAIQNISFIGSGNVATHLAKAFAKKGITVKQIYSQSCDNSETLAWQSNSIYTCDLEELDLSVDLLIFAVKDDVIKTLSQYILKKKPDMKMVHTSGSVGLDVFENATNTGIFYPLQSFSKTKKIDIEAVPFLITSNNDVFKNELMSLAKLLSDKVYEYTDEQRKHLHIAAVFVNNFSNHLFAIAQNYCEKHQLDYQLLMPLIHETITKIDSILPKDAQTGPARRNDVEIIDKHLTMLKEEDSQLFQIYQLLTNSILKMYS